MKWLALFMVLALAAGGGIGCVTSSTVTDGDRQVVDQARKANQAAIADLEKAQAASVEGSESWTMIGLGLRKLGDVERGTAHLQEVHGPPTEPKVYTEAEMTAAIAKSKEEHARSPFSQILLGGLGIAAGVGGTLLGMPWLANLAPKLTGRIGELAKTGVEIVTAARKKAEEGGGRISIKDLLAIAKEYNVSAGVDDLAKARAAEYEKKLGFTPTVKLAEEPAAAAT
jgi:hypothetical protein